MTIADQRTGSPQPGPALERHHGQDTCLYSKRLERGRFIWPSPAEGVVRLTSAQLATLLEGLPWHRLQPRAIPRPSTAW
jgi:transposase